MSPLVLLPGMMCDARLFAAQVDALSPYCDVAVLPITEFETIGELASDVLSKAPESFALAGLSMGGIVAMEIIAKAPERVERLALLDTNPLAEQAVVSKNRLRQIEKVRQGDLKAVMRDEMKPLYLAESGMRESHLALCMDMAMSLGPEVFIRQSKALAARHDQSDTLRSVDVPTLVLCGCDDTLCPVERHELMHELIPNSVLSLVNDAGHLPPLENPAQTNRNLQQWLGLRSA